MRLIFTAFIMIMWDRLAPYAMYRFSSEQKVGNLDELYKRYGAFRFPRTLLIILNIFIILLAHFIKINDDILVIAVLGVMILFCIFAGVDSWNARAKIKK